MLDYVYVPDTQPMDIDGWPTLADMIISNKRVVVMLAYDADQQKVCGCDITPYQRKPSLELTGTDPLVTGYVVVPMANTLLSHGAIFPLHCATPSRPGP